TVISRGDILPTLMFELTERLRIDVAHRSFLVFGLWRSRTAARYVTECSDVVTGQPDSHLFLEPLTLDKNAQLFVADFSAFLKRDLVSARKHERRNYE